MHTLGECSASENSPASLLKEIAPFFRMADEIESRNPRVAYLCRLYALNRACELDPASLGPGVLQFKIALLKLIRRDKIFSLKRRFQESDIMEVLAFKECSFNAYIRASENAADKADRERHIAKANLTDELLSVVSEYILVKEFMDIDQKVLEIQHEAAEKSQIDAPYNILPLYPGSANQAILEYPEIQASALALRDTRGLLWPEDHRKEQDGDILDWLQAMFGFQKDNVANQREHLILLLANVHNRGLQNADQPFEFDGRALTEVMEKLFKNYKKWCMFMDVESSLCVVNTQQEWQQRRLLYVGLYLLIWGEAANLRFMPECLCYIFHHLKSLVKERRRILSYIKSSKELCCAALNCVFSWAVAELILAFLKMAMEVHCLLGHFVDPLTGESLKPAYGGEEEAFLREVVTPIYEVIAKEVERSKHGRSAHSEWRNYDDFNEYFWSRECFKQLGWPMRGDADFFHLPDEQVQFQKTKNSEPGYRDQWVGKVNFVEIRTFWHIFRSYDRMWSFFILCLQAMIIVAWNDSGDPTALFTPDVFKKVSSIFVTAAILKLGQAVLDVVLTWKARRNMSVVLMLSYDFKIISAVGWVFVLTVTYPHLWENPPGSPRTIKSRFGNFLVSPPSFILAVVVYLFQNNLAAWFLRSLDWSLDWSLYRNVKPMMWTSLPPLYVGRRMHESAFSLFRYMLFWVILIITKLAFSYYTEIKPLVGQTKAMMGAQVTKFQLHEFYAWAKHNIGIVIALWAPIILVYFMDTQIWYAIFSTFLGGIHGMVCRLGEIRTLRILRCRFQYLPALFNAWLVPKENGKQKQDGSEMTSSQTGARILSNKEKARFAHLWNTVITSFREEDLITNREMNLLLVPYRDASELNDIIQLPPFLLAGKIHTAIYLASKSDFKEWDLRYRIESDSYLSLAICECYAQLRSVINFLVKGKEETQIISKIFAKVQEYIFHGVLFSKIKMSALPTLYDHFVQLIECLLDNKPEDSLRVTLLLVDMVDIFAREMMVDDHIFMLIRKAHVRRGPQNPLFAYAGATRFPIEQATEAWEHKIKRVNLLLTTGGLDGDIPSNSEARKRIFFFSSSLFMEMPTAPKVRNMLSFSVLTPYNGEDVLFSEDDLEMKNGDNVSFLFYLRKFFPDEWTNFLERVNCKSEEELRASDKLKEQLCLWASYRGQTLTRTVRGMMYYRKALELQAFLDMAIDGDLYKGERLRVDQSLLAQCQAEADMKFTYVVSYQQHDIDKRSGRGSAEDILRLMTMYPSVRVAYIDEVEEPSLVGTKLIIRNSYYSTLAKAALPKPIYFSERAPNSGQVIYRIKLPGPAILGEGKPENQNHAIIFTRGEGLQTIDMNQDNYMEEALKMRNLLQEFLKKHDGVKYPTILGLREHIFTVSDSYFAWFISNLKTSFGSIGQRLLANPLKVRFHYGHPDVFDRLFHLARGGVSKASKVINLSGDMYAGFNSTLREGNVTHHEYIQVGKGSDVGLNQISMFEAKLANGNGEQTLSRDVYRLGRGFDFFRMLSFYFTTVGFYFSTLITVLTVYVFLYGRLCLVLSGLDEDLSTHLGIKDNKPLQVALASQSFIQMGFSLVLPMLMEIFVERGFPVALGFFLVMQLQFAPVFFTFSLGTKAHYYGRTLLHGRAKYRATGRGLVVFHAKFADNYRMYSRSHFVKGFELMILQLVYQILSQSGRGADVDILITICIWFLVGSWLFAPFIFNPSGFERHEIVDDWTDWIKWICRQDGTDVHPESSWEAWWEEEQEHLRYTGKCGIIAEIILALRFAIYAYGLIFYVYSQPGLASNSFSKKIFIVMVMCIFWLMISLTAFVVKAFDGKQGEAWVLLTLLVALAIPSMSLTMCDAMVCYLACILKGWGLLLIGQACKPLAVKFGMWNAVQTVALAYEIIMGFFVFALVAIWAWFSCVLKFLSRFRGFSRGFLGGERKDKDQTFKENDLVPRPDHPCSHSKGAVSKNDCEELH